MSHCVIVGSNYNVVQVDNQPNTSRHNTIPVAFTDPSITLKTNATYNRGCNNDGEGFGDNNPVLSEYTILHRRETDLYQLLTDQQVLVKIDRVNTEYLNAKMHIK